MEERQYAHEAVTLLENADCIASRPAVKYRPPSRESSSGNLVQALEQGALTADELLRRYCTMVYAQTGSYEETARRLQIDRRTAKSRVDAGLLERLKAGHA